MGTCVNILGIPILEDKDCRDKRLKRKNERVDTRQSGHTDRVESRTDRVEARTAPGATVPAASAIGTVTDGVLGFLGLGGGEAPADLTPLLLGGAGLVAVVYMSNRDKKGKR